LIIGISPFGAELHVRDLMKRRRLQRAPLFEPPRSKNDLRRWRQHTRVEALRRITERSYRLEWSPTLLEALLEELLCMPESRFSLSALMLWRSSVRFSSDVVCLRLACHRPPRVGSLPGGSAPRDPRVATPAPGSGALTAAAAASDTIRPSTLGLDLAALA
jgi:hypothetical protein